MTTDGIQWSELFQSFAAATDLCIDDELAPRVVQAFQELASERATEVLPAIRSISLGRASTIRDYTGSDQVIHCRAAALRSPCGHPPLRAASSGGS